MFYCKRFFINKPMAAIVLLLGVVVSGWAVRGGNDPEERKAYSSRRSQRAAVVLPAEQRAALQAAQDEGIDVTVRPGWETRVSIRGKKLGERRSYSGGRGLKKKGKGAYSEDAIAVLDNLSPVMAVRHAEEEFSVQKVKADRLGFHHVRVKQRHKGLRVVGGDMIVHFNKANEAYQVNGSYVPEVAVDTVPAIDADAAVQIALKDLKGQGHELDQPARTPELVVFARQRSPVLAYELLLSSLPDASGTPGCWRYWVDAMTGEVLMRYNDIKDISAPSSNGSHVTITGKILTGEDSTGTDKFVTGWHDLTYSAYYLWNKDLNWYIYNHSTYGDFGSDAGEYAHRTTDNWAQSDRSAMSGAINFNATQDYFSSVHGLNSFNNTGVDARANIHYLYPYGYVNAYWSPYQQQFFFGDGDGITANSLLVMDVVAHEYTHAVTEHSADLIYSYESGALNESFSDIFGACVEFAAQDDGRGFYPNSFSGRADWLMGEDCWLSSTALRDMRNPRNTAVVGTGNEQPSRYFGEHWYAGDGDNGGVHYNSGVQNFFFYLLCEGGSGNNDGIPYNVAGIGIDAAEEIAYRTLTVYCTSSSDYRDIRGHWITAAHDLYPAHETLVGDIWEICGVGPLEILPKASVEFEGQQGGPFRPWLHTYTLNNQGGASISWTAENSESWLQVSPTSGSIAPGASATVTLELTAAASGLTPEVYTDSLKIKRAGTGAVLGSREIVLRVGQPDYFSENFSEYDFDLDGLSLTFTKDASSPSGYTANALPIASLPTDPTSHTVLSLLDDDNASPVSVVSGPTVELYGVKYTKFFVGSNGYITFLLGDDEWYESFEDHFDLPRISAFFNDLDPSAGGSVRWAQLVDRMVVTYLNVPQYSSAGGNTFQIEMYFDGTIRLSWFGLSMSDGLVGLSNGNELPDYFGESDLSEFAWDFDGDTIPNWWEDLYFGGLTGCVAGDDFDGDGQSNLKEFIANTHPKDIASVFRVTQQSVIEEMGEEKFVLSWDSEEDRIYSVWRGENLFLPLELVEEGIGYPGNSYTETIESGQDKCFYKIDVKLFE